MESSLEATIKLVELIREHPVIYDGTISYRHDPGAHIAAWADVSGKVGGRSYKMTEGSPLALRILVKQATTAECKKRYKKLRYALCRRVRDGRHKVMPEGIEPHLSFLMPLVRPRNAEGPKIEDRLEYNAKLVELIRNRPSLYNGTNARARPALWEVVARKLREAYPESSASGPDCKQKWRKFRYSYNLFLRKGYKFRPWGIEEHCRFLLPYLQYKVPERVDAYRTARKLINLVRCYPCLYDGSDIRERTIAWEAVAKGMEATPQECLRKWLKLRDGFRRHLRGAKDLHPRGIEVELCFLEPYLTESERSPLVELYQSCAPAVDEDELFVMQFVNAMGQMSASQKRLFRLEAVRAVREVLDG